MEEKVSQDMIDIIESFNDHVGGDWINSVDESLLKEANKIRSTSTQKLKQMIDEDSVTFGLCNTDFAKQELVYRSFNEDQNHSGSDGGYHSEFCEYLDEESLNDFCARLIAENKLTLDEQRNVKIASLVLESDVNDLMRAFILSTDISDISSASIKEEWAAYKEALLEHIVKIGTKTSIRAIRNWGALKKGTVLKGTWLKTSFDNQLRLDVKDGLPGATMHPSIFYDKKTKSLQIPKHFEII